MTRVLLTGGGTAGHVFPALAVAKALREAQPDITLLYVGSSGGPEGDLAHSADIPFIPIATGKMRRYFSLKNLIDQFRIPYGICQALGILLSYKPQVVLATGGYVAVPPVIAARLRHIPIIIHEQTTQIGLANRINARFATRIALSWESALSNLDPRYQSKAWVTGNPVRAQVFLGDAQKAVTHFELSKEELPVIYITGGSLGARIINRAVEEALPRLLQKARIIHQCGAQVGEKEPDLTRLQAAAARLPKQLQKRYAVTPFIRDELADVFALASLVVGRSGAGTVTELCALGKPALYIPLVPTGGDEQTRNAQMAEHAGAAVIITQSDLNAETLFAKVEELLADLGKLREMGQAALPLVKTGAAQTLAQAVLDAAK